MKDLRKEGLWKDMQMSNLPNQPIRGVPKEKWSKTKKKLLELLSDSGGKYREELIPPDHVMHGTEEGQKFAWQMKLHDQIGEAVFLVRDPATGDVERVRPEDQLNEYQARSLPGRPEMILLFAQHLARQAEARGTTGVEVRAQVCISLNGRRESWLIDPERDLSRVNRSIWPSDWILPLEHPPERPTNPRGREKLRCEPPAS